MAKSKMNGSVSLLAKAMRQVFREAVEEGTKPLKDSMDERFAELKQDMDDRFTRVETDMQNGFAELRPPK